MKLNKNLRAIFLAGILIFAAAGCGGDSSPQPNAADAEECAVLLKQAQEKMAGLESLRMELKSSMVISLGKDSSEYETTAKMDMTTDPYCIQLEMADRLGSSTETFSGFVEKDAEGFVLYVNTNGTWIGRHMTEQASAQYDARGNLSLYLNGMENCRNSGTENIGGSEASKIEGVIRNDVLAEAMQNSANIMNSIESLGLNAEDVQAAVPEIPVAAWINGDGYIVQFEMDMTKMMDFIMKHFDTEGHGKMETDRCTAIMQFSNFNALAPIEIPAEARDAIMLEE